MDLFLELLRTAVNSEASDIHIKAGGPIMFRILRDLHPIDVPIPTDDWVRQVLEQIVPGHLKDRFERDREIDFALALSDIGRFRVNVFQQRGSFVIAMRIVRTAIRNFQSLNLPDRLRQIAETPRGIVIIAGAPGAGKSTTLAAMIEHLNLTRRQHIITLEDPIEYFFEDKLAVIEQREVGLDTTSFSSGLRNVLRQDPDVLVIGEMRDAASVSAAVSAANVGTLVISTLHTGDAPRSIQRILDFFPGPDREQARRQLAGTLRAVACQKLVRTGAGEVVPAVEILLNNSAVARVIESDRLEKLFGIIELGNGDGMQTFDQSLHQLFADGRISATEALAHSPNPDAFRMKLQGVTLSDSRRILGARD